MNSFLFLSIWIPNKSILKRNAVSQKIFKRLTDTIYLYLKFVAYQQKINEQVKQKAEITHSV